MFGKCHQKSIESNLLHSSQNFFNYLNWGATENTKVNKNLILNPIISFILEYICIMSTIALAYNYILLIDAEHEFITVGKSLAPY